MVEKEDLKNLFQENAAGFYNFSLRWVFDGEKAQELVQECFVRLWEKRQSLEVDRLKPYAYRTLRNMAINEYRRSRTFEKVVEGVGFFLGLDDENQLEGSLMDKQNWQLIKPQLDQMPIHYREVLLLSYFSEMSTKEIAQSLNLKEGTVSSRKNRALEMLRGKIKFEEAYA